MNKKERIDVRFCEGLGIFDRQYVYREIDSQEIHKELTGKVVDIQVAHSRKFQKGHKLRRIGILDDTTRAALANAVASVETNQHFVEGNISLDYKLPADRAAVRLYNSNYKEASIT